ncbi:thioredoxin domain-containing protein [Brachybacterium sp. Marseille-Q2903]|uniref:Thioredoxin domain-containing protein n=1 Tax=Brachybacterium epidermidis TaxID=2781983 RepID=A0ABR9W724_9MICO|nr:thioredoxin domain-containing protein [Brachybacterium epidermidis]MBE9405180.1 thioredoxin domain-containing protein [Brachybacterium epidermidis]
MTAPEDPTPSGATEQRPDRPWVVPAAIVAVAALLIAGVLLRPGGEEADTAGQEPQQQASSQAEPAQGHGAIEHPSEVAAPDLSGQESRDPDDLLAEGPVDAPVVMVVFTDFQCQYCARWSEETLPVMRAYVQRGELRIEWRDVNIYGENSERAARASLAAAMQGEHEEYHDALFEGGQIRSERELSEEALVDLAGELGLDTEQFEADMNSEAVASTVAENAQQGIDLGAFSTPSFIVGGTPMVGAQPTAVFTDAVDEALDRAGA